MITETLLPNDLIERRSDKNVYIRNDVTGGEYTKATDYTNEKRIELGLVPYSYSETDIPIEEEKAEEEIE